MMIPLHVHSNYSLLRGVCTTDQIIEHAKSFSLSAIALTDYNGMYGLIKFAKRCAEANIKPVVGAFIDEEHNKDINAVILAKNNNGYAELCKLITARKLNDDFSLTKIVNSNPKNLFVITSSLTLLEQSVNHENLYAGIYSTRSSHRQVRRLFDLSKTRNVKQVIAHPVYFPVKEDFETHRVLSAIRTNCSLDNISSDELVDEEFYFQTPEKLLQTWRSLPDAVEAVKHIVDNCNVDFRLGEYKFPVYPDLKNETSINMLRRKCYKGMTLRYGANNSDATARVNKELEIIDELNFADYFLIVWDIVKEAKKRGMLTIGRGSAANSIVSYCLGLTEVDPIKHNLYFERFLNKARSTPPDVDIDFSWKERDEIIKYVFERYGYERVAMISTHVTFRARSAFRETAKAFGISDREISRLSKFIPWTSAVNLTNITELFPESKSLNLKQEPWKSIVDIAVKIGGFPRHLSIHPGGIVITPTPITNYVALEYAKNKGLGLIITQPDMYSIEDYGLIKIDLLSQRSLGVLRDTMNSLEKNHDLNSSK